MSVPKAQEPPRKKFRLMSKIVNGGIAGIVGVCVVFPLDLVKTRLQNQTVSPTGTPQYKNILDCFKKTYAAEGYLGMYRGSAVNIILVSPEKAVKLASYDFFIYQFRKKYGSAKLRSQVIAGALSGACQSTVSCPMELLKIQMQDAGRVAAQAKEAGKSFKRITALQLIKTLLKKEGIGGFYRGIGATAIRDIFFNVVYFPLFTSINNMGPVKTQQKVQPFWWSFIAGCVAGSTAALTMTPMDVIKTRLQTLNKGTNERTYSSVSDCITKTWMYEGIKAFFKGGACRMMVIAPLYGIVQAVYFFGISENYLGIT